MYENEIIKIKSMFDPDVFQLFKESGVILAGGALTSIFCNRDVNDLDMYFKTKDGWCNVLREIYNKNTDNFIRNYDIRISHYTNRSILCVSDSRDVQLIGFKEFKDIDSIFKSFDFTINMCAFDFETETLTVHEDFMKHNSQRFLAFNEKTDFPMISALRVDKYRERGYTISKTQMFRLLLAVNAKEFKNWEDFKKELGGLYGLNPDEIVDETKEFSLEEAMLQLDKVFIPNKHYNLKSNPEFKELMKTFSHMVDDETQKWLTDCEINDGDSWSLMHIKSTLGNNSKFYKV